MTATLPGRPESRLDGRRLEAGLRPARRAIRQVVRQTLVEPVREGRLLDDGWPVGLRALVLLAYAGFGAAGLTVIASGAIRSRSPLVLNGTGSIGLPEGAVWPLVLLLSLGLALFLTAALHTTWWLRVMALVLTLASMGQWSLRSVSLGGSLLWTVLGVAAVLAQLVFVLVRWRRRFAWWEFAVIWGLVGTAMVVGVAQTRYSRIFGYDFNPLMLQLLASTLGTLALPAAMVAGASVAEVTVRATLAATQTAQRFLHRRWPFALLGGVVIIRLVQCVRQIQQRDTVADDWATIITAAAVFAGLAAVGVMVKVALRPQPGEVPPVAELSEHVGRVGLAVAAILVSLGVVVSVLLASVQIVGSIGGSRLIRDLQFNPTPIISALTDPTRVLTGVALILLAVRAARRGRLNPALINGCIGVMLIAYGRAWFFGDLTRIAVDADWINLLTTLAMIIAALVMLVRRRLSADAALAVAGVLVLCALFSYRDFISDPVGALLGFSGAALVLFGLTWDLLTGSQWGNGDSRRFPRPARVLLVLTNSLITMSVLAYAALVRDGSSTIYLDQFAGLGDFVFGTALIAAAVIRLLGVGSTERTARDTEATDVVPMS